jgi:CSLREA domain-containing protein
MSHLWRVSRFALLLAALMITGAVIVKPVYAANTYVVNSTADSADGVCNAANCTLRDAIVAAEAHSGKDKIRFNIPGAGPHTITAASGLPAMEQPIDIDASTAESNTNCTTGTLHIVLDGAGAPENGLYVRGNSSIVRGLVLQNSMVLALQSVEKVKITCNFLGTDVTGTAATANPMGIYMSIASNNTIGGTNPGDRNLISGNFVSGMWIDDISSNNKVLGNLIGTDLAGTAAVPNDVGIYIASGTGNVIGGTAASARNVISGNASDGIYLLHPVTMGNKVQGNYIGVDKTGTAALENGGQGVRLDAVGPDNLIGGTAAGARNVISGNDGNGIFITNGSVDTLVQGNFIGTNADGDAAIPNEANGIHANSAFVMTIGGTAAGAGNVISGNPMSGITLQDSDDNLVQGNFIGTDATGTAAIPNMNQGGIFIWGGDDNTIGGTVAGARNIISGNDGNGVTILLNGTDNVVQGNYIGTDVTGMLDLGNSFSGVNVQQANGNMIGGTAAGAGNVISGNGSGIYINFASVNTVQNNIVGLSAHGALPMGSFSGGVMAGNGATVIANGNIISAHAFGMQVDTTPGSSLNADGAGNPNCIVGNDVGFQNDNSVAQDAENNWWGVSTGPNTAGSDTTAGTGAVDADPFVTTRPTNCAPYDVLVNGGMEIDVEPPPFDDRPDDWTFNNLAPTDMMDSVHHGGSASMKLDGDGANKKMMQTVNLSGLKGQTVRFTLWTNTLDVPTSGAFKVTVKITYAGGSSKSYTVNLPSGTNGWEESLPIQFTADKNFNKLQVTLTFDKANGTVWIDDAVLNVTP